MEILRTPEERFADLPDFPYEPHYTQLGDLRMAHVEAGSQGTGTVLLVHGEPSYSFLYRKMIPVLVEAGYQVVAPDLIGCGRSDKPAERSDYSYQRHVDWFEGWLEANRLESLTLFCQDWGSLIGLRAAIDMPERFERIVLANGGLPVGEEGGMTPAFHSWLEFSQNSRYFSVSRIINQGCVTNLSQEVKAAYDAPFPDDAYKAGVRVFPALVPLKPDDPGAKENRLAWRKLMRWEKPFLTAFSDGDPITHGGEKPFQRLVPGAKDQPHVTIHEAGHFLQEDKGVELAKVIIDFMNRTGG